MCGNCERLEPELIFVPIVKMICIYTIFQVTISLLYTYRIGGISYVTKDTRVHGLTYIWKRGNREDWVNIEGKSFKGVNNPNEVCTNKGLNVFACAESGIKCLCVRQILEN